jgi:hypothetical protein
MNSTLNDRGGFRSVARAAIAAVAMLALSEGRVLGQAEAPTAEPKPPAAPKTAVLDAKPGEPAAEDPGEFSNWITFGLGHYFTHGDDAQFKYRRQSKDGTFGGIEDFHFERPVGKQGLFQIDGRGIFDNNDYDLKLGLSHPEKGYIRGGYREFRTWYDGSGGYSQGSNSWVSLYNEELHLDRGEAWIEAGLTMPDIPIISLRYAYQFRDGKKDSTSWGDYNLLFPGAGSAITRGIVPSFWDIDEKRHIVQGDVKHIIGNTEAGLGLRYEISDNDNSRNMRRRPGEQPPVSTPGSDRHLTQEDGVRTDLFNVHASTETRFNDKTLFTMGYSFTTLDTDISGSRIYGPNYDAIYDPNFSRRQGRDEGFVDLMGGSRMDQHVANLNLMYNPWDFLAVIPSVRIEDQSQAGTASFTETAVGTGAGLPTVEDDITNKKSREFIDLSEALEVRYTGFKKWSLYARGEFLQGQGNLREREREAPSGPVELFRDTDLERSLQKYVVGANWYPHRKINLAGQYYYKVRNNDYDHNEDTASFAPPLTNDFYPAFIRQQDFNTHDFNVRVTWRALSSLTLVSRYDYQMSTIDTQGDTDFAGAPLGEVQSAEMISHILSQSVSWTPLARLFLQGSVSYVLDSTDTPADNIDGAARGLVQTMYNDYWNASTMVGFVVNEATDLQAQYYYYRADNFQDNSAYSQPYGASAQEHGVTATLIHRFSRNLLGKLTYGYFTYDDETSGHHNDYHAHLVYSSLQYRF